MKTFIVDVKEIWIQPVEVQARNKVEAMMLVQDGSGEAIMEDKRYGYTDHSVVWEIKEKSN